MIGRGGEGLVNVKYLKIINKTFPSDDKDLRAYHFLTAGLAWPGQRKMIKFSSRLRQNCLNNQSPPALLVPILSSVGYK